MRFHLNFSEQVKRIENTGYWRRNMLSEQDRETTYLFTGPVAFVDFFLAERLISRILKRSLLVILPATTETSRQGV